jgi:3-oxoacyl-[acyl-carrier-protein] synthase II
MCGQGLDVPSAWDGLKKGMNPVKQFSLFDPSGLGCTFGMELPAGAEEVFSRLVMTRNRRQMTRATMMAMVTARMALADAGLDFSENAAGASRTGVVIGATGTGYAPLAPDNALDEHRILRNMANASASWISLKEKITGPSMTVSTACSSGASALHAAFSLIADNECDVVVAGASDSSISYLDVAGFCSLRALSEQNSDFLTASRPFDKDRNGFVMGEGCGVLIVESLDHALARHAAIHAVMPRPALMSEAYNILSPRPDGTGMATAMRRSLDNAALKPADIDYVNAHGTSTPQNDRMESQAIRDVFGGHVSSLLVSSTKSMTGHCLGAAAAVEAVICCMAIREGIVPPTINLAEPDPPFDIDFVAGKARSTALRHVMSNSFAFGGHNGVCIFSRREARHEARHE